MKNHDHHNRAKAYLEETMSNRERQAFEAALEKDEGLQEAFLKYALSMELPRPEQEDKWREILERIRREKGPLPEPTLNFFDYLKYAFSPGVFWKTGLGLLAAVFAGIVIWANLALKPDEELIDKYFIEAYCPGVAGEGSSSTEMDRSFERASNFYCGYAEGGADSLKVQAERCPGFCMAKYYLAHWQLKSGHFESAAEGFTQCLDNEASLLQYGYTSLAEPVRLNLLLARLGAGYNRKDILEGLQALKNGESAEETRAAESLYDELSAPFRFLLVR